MRRSLPAIRIYLMLLLLAAFVVVPVAEALACAQEATVSVGDVHALQSDSDSESSKSKDSSSADACGHGHCHHSTASLPAAGHDDLFADGRISLHSTEHGDVYALRLDGPMRPPPYLIWLCPALAGSSLR